MNKFFILVILAILVSGCYSTETTHTYNVNYTRAKSESNPIYLTFKDTKDAPFYFILKRDSKEKDYKLIAHWKSPYKSEPLFNGQKTTLKFMINNLEIISLNPIKRPKLSSYSIESRGHEEEAIFSLDYDQLMAIANAKSATAELRGKHKTVVGVFNKRNSFRGFKNFLKNAH